MLLLHLHKAGPQPLLERYRAQGRAVRVARLLLCRLLGLRSLPLPARRQLLLGLFLGQPELSPALPPISGAGVG